jgi:DHA2 family methylenomycin A resistance protein-like MFS transporter
VLNAARQAGGAVGVALLGTLLAGGSLVAGLHGAMGLSAAAFLLAAAVTAVSVERPSGALMRAPRQPRPKALRRASSWE